MLASRVKNQAVRLAVGLEANRVARRAKNPAKNPVTSQPLRDTALPRVNTLLQMVSKAHHATR